MRVPQPSMLCARFTKQHGFEKPNDERGLQLMNKCALVIPTKLLSAMKGCNTAALWPRSCPLLSLGICIYSEHSTDETHLVDGKCLNN